MRPMNVLLIEDDEKVCKEFEKLIEGKNDMKIVAKTNSSKEAIKLVQLHKPDGIILDLELHYGTGSGFEFLKELKNIKMQNKPAIVVNTNIISDVVYDNLHKDLVDIIFYKKQKNYSPQMVIDSMLLLRKNHQVAEIIQQENLEDNSKKIKELINTELNFIGINYKLKGRDYIFDAIYYILVEEQNGNEGSVFQHLANKYKLLTSSISRAIQTAINEAWRTSPIEDLKEHYTAKINYHTGVPTPTEFIYYYVEKITEMTKND